MRRRLGILLLPVALLALGLRARSLAGDAFRAFTHYETPFAFAAGDTPSGTPPLTGQVVLVLIDGLGLGPSRTLPFLNELRGRGADFGCRIGLPSLSLPGRAGMLTGAWQEIHGQATNYNPKRLRVDHVFGSARRAGLATALAAGENAHKLFAPYVVHAVVYPKEPESAPFAHYEAAQRRQGDATRALLRDAAPAFAYLELNAVDEAGHGWGSTSEEYRRAALGADEEIRQVAGTLDLTRSTLIVTSDHGHVPVGGHGGGEEPVMQVPLILVGAGVRAGARGRASQVDVASTLASLLGIGIPASNQGRPLLDALQLDPAGRMAVLSALAAQREAFVSRYVTQLLALGDDGGGEVPAVPASGPARDEEALNARLAKLDEIAEGVKQRRLLLESRLRSRRSLAAVVVPLVAALALLATGILRGRELGEAVVAASLGAVLYHLLLPVAGLSYSLTAVNKDEWLAAYFRKDMALGVACCAASVMGVGLWRRRQGPGDRWELARSAWLVAAVFCYLFVLKIAIVYWRHGVFLRWHMPDQYWASASTWTFSW